MRLAAMDGGGTYRDVQNGAQNEGGLSLTGNFCCGITLAKSMMLRPHSFGKAFITEAKHGLEASGEQKVAYLLTE